ncbi:MAG: Rha family transcriptional regulator, partial [Microcystaceae cyanobacterium]
TAALTPVSFTGVAMPNLTVRERDGVLVVDSRLVAVELGVNHGDWLKNVLLKYQQEIEQEFGVIGFANGKPFKSPKGGRPERFAWLTEEQATVLMTYSRNTDQVRRCKRQLVKAFSEAKQVIPAQAQEIERLKLELELAKTQERLMLTTQAITTLHGSSMVALILGKPDAVMTKTERVETLVTVDRQGQAINQYDGVGITYLAKRYGFGNKTKACRYWLESIGISETQWLSEPSLVTSRKLSRETLTWLDQQYAARTGVRQRLIGE